ncbi:SRPBCC family protein [Actinokineospora sp.]|uniref:SRPBCC family protein n=1 Tax=Actinokineospora sp. TaxID=1872133 RepID=UPI0040379DDD
MRARRRAWRRAVRRRISARAARRRGSRCRPQWSYREITRRSGCHDESVHSPREVAHGRARKPFLLREETLEYEQDRRHVHALRSPAPIKDYRGEITLVPREAGGTDLTWRCRFVERVPGTGRRRRDPAPARVRPW